MKLQHTSPYKNTAWYRVTSFLLELINKHRKVFQGFWYEVDSPGLTISYQFEPDSNEIAVDFLLSKELHDCKEIEDLWKYFYKVERFNDGHGVGRLYFPKLIEKELLKIK